MNTITLSHKSISKHLSFDQISFIVSEVAHFDASCNGKKEIMVKLNLLKTSSFCRNFSNFLHHFLSNARHQS